MWERELNVADDLIETKDGESFCLEEEVLRRRRRRQIELFEVK